jgi:hypothetical protein
MDTKNWWKSKQIWAWIVAGVIGMYNVNPFGWPVIPDFVYGILAAFGVYNRVNSTPTKIG